MKVSKQVTLNIGNYESLKIAVDDVPTYEHADAVLIDELKRIGIPPSKKIKQCLGMQTGIDAWM
jgi:hypothetical protein